MSAQRNLSRRVVKILTVVGVMMLGLVTLARAQIPTLINFQGRLVQGQTVIDGPVTLTFTFWDNYENGNQLGDGVGWSETQEVTASKGIFNTFIGSVKPIPSKIFEGDNVWL